MNPKVSDYSWVLLEESKRAARFGSVYNLASAEIYYQFDAQLS